MANLVVSGDTSGSVTLTAPAIAGSPVVTLPNTTGTLALTSQISVTGALIRAPQILTSGTSYTTPANCTAIYVEAVAGGGAGGSATTAAAVPTGSGGGGGYCAKYFTVTANTSYTYAIGSGGTAVSNAAGNAGGNTTFTVGGTTITSIGGGGGLRGSSGEATGGTGGGGVNGDFIISGGTAGQTANTTNVTGFKYFVAGGGGSMFGAPSASRITLGGANGTAAENYGVGGTGGVGVNLGPCTGGAGSNGVIRIWEFT